MIKQRKSIFFHLTLAYLCLGLLPLCLAGVVLYSQFRRNIERVMLDDMSHMVSYAAHNVEELVEECDDLTKLVYDVTTEDGSPLWMMLKDNRALENKEKFQINAVMKDIQERDSKIRSVYFIDRYGQVYYATSNTQKVLDETKLKQWLKEAGEQERGLTIYATHRDDYFPQSRNHVITFSRSYRDVSGIKTLEKSLGTIYVDIDITKLSRVIQDVDMARQGEFRVLDSSGFCIYSTEEGETGTDLGGEAYLFAGTEQAKGNIRNRNNYQVYQEIGECGWRSVLQIPREFVMRNLDQTRKAVAVFLTLSFVILAVLYYYFLRKIKKPVELIEQGMNDIRKGDLSTRVHVDREDELGLLADGLNHMAEELEIYIHKVYVAEIRQREAELDALKSQIKPHYLYNTLDVIRMMALEHDDRETAAMVESLSRQLKYLIGYNSDLVPLKRELENIREYFLIMKVRYENRIHLELDIEKEVMDCGIIKLSLQPIVENAVKHGLRPKKGDGTVRIEAHKDGSILEITVLEDGVGMDESTMNRLRTSLDSEQMGVLEEDGWHHVGLKNAYDRIRKNFGEEYGMEIDSTPGLGTVVVYRLPLIDVKDSRFWK